MKEVRNADRASQTRDESGPGAVVELDDLDHKIIGFLQRDGRIPYTAIAAQLDVAEGTVRKRVNRLLDEGILKVVGYVNPFKLGLNTVAIVGIRIEGNGVEEITDKLAGLTEVRYIGVAAGTYDLIIEVLVRSNEELFEFLTHKLRQIPGISASDTSLVMKVCKERFTWRPER